MKKIIALFILAISTSFVFAQEKAMVLVSFESSDTIATVMEGDIYKVTPQTGDTTSEVKYFYRGQRKSAIINVEDSLFSTYGTQLLEGTGLGFVINVNQITGVVRVSDTACTLFYSEGNQDKRYELSISVGEFRALVNAL